jgi:hypothetical protein
MREQSELVINEVHELEEIITKLTENSNNPELSRGETGEKK